MGRVSRLIGWGHWFTFVNIIISMLIGIRYFNQAPWPESWLGQVYLFSSWIGHFSFLAFIFYLLILFPLTFLIPSRKLFRFVAVFLFTLAISALLIDTQTYLLINLHLTPAVWDVVIEPQNSNLSEKWNILFFLLPVIFVLQLTLSEWIWRKQRKISHKHIGRPISAFLIVSFISSHLIFIWSDANFHTPVTNQQSNFPLAYPMTAKTFMEKHGLFDERKYLEHQEKTEFISYPLEELNFNRRGRELNVLLISVNNLRQDGLTAELMPSTHLFAQKSTQFTQHFSSSNYNDGLFGLFYGLPNSYSDSISQQKESPLFLNIMQDQGYLFNYFGNGETNKNIEYNFASSSLAFNSYAEENGNDKHTVKSWEEWVNESPKDPWFSYVELNRVGNSTDFRIDDTNMGDYEGEIKSAYYRSVTNTDKSIEKILSSIEKEAILDETIVIITSNHGFKFNNGHSNYSHSQLQVPMIVYWPGKQSAVYDHNSSHLDVSVTLMQDLLGVSSKANTYSSGQNLYNERSRLNVLAGNCNEIALISSSGATTVIDKSGNYQLFDQEYRLIKNDRPKLALLIQGLNELKRFYPDKE